MTPQEHLLTLTLFTKQAQMIKIIVDALQSRGILTGDDARAFEFAVSADAASSAALFQQSKEKYLQLAKGLGIQTGLENLPFASADFFRPEKP